jgi:hypothetical protein
MDGLQPEQLCTLFRWLKEGPPGAIPIEHEGRSLGHLQAVGWEEAGNSAAVEQLARWHLSAGATLPTTPSTVRQWLEQVLHAPDRVLFWVRDARGRAVGHIAILAHDAATVTIGDVLCGEPAAARLLAAASGALAGWVSQELGLRVRCDRPRRSAA